MKQTKKTNPKTVDKEIAEFTASDFFKTLTVAEQERAVQEIRRHWEVRNRNLKRPLWSNWFPNIEKTSELFVLEDVWLNARTRQPTEKTNDGNNPLLGGYGDVGALALAIHRDYGQKHLEQMLDDVAFYFKREICAGDPKTAADLTPKQIAILELDDLLENIRNYISRGIWGHETVSCALSFGAALMRLSIVFPDGNQDALFRSIKELPKRIVDELKKRAGKKNNIGAPARYTQKKMQQAFNRMHPLINNAGLSQLEAANKVIMRMGLTIGAPYLVQCYRDWLPSRVGNSAK